MDKIRNIALTVTAVAAAMTVLIGYGKRVIAQEARKEAAAQMAPATEELSEIKDLLRRQEDREAFKVCMDYQYQDDPVEVRNQKCTAESNARWAYWQCEDETPKSERREKCGTQP